MTEIDKKNLTVAEAAQVYGLTQSWLYKQTSLRTIPLFKIGSKVLIPVGEFEQWLDEHRVDVKGREK